MTLGTGDFDTFARGLLGSLRNERDGPQVIALLMLGDMNPH